MVDNCTFSFYIRKIHIKISNLCPKNLKLKSKIPPSEAFSCKQNKHRIWRLKFLYSIYLKNSNDLFDPFFLEM